MAFTLRWGIVATGGISQKFAANLLFESPAARGCPEVAHQLVAVGSRSVPSAQKFIDTYCAHSPTKIEPKGSYQEVFDHPEVDCIYIGSPHSNHYAEVLAALDAGKNVLCEKAFTVNAKQVKILIDKAKEKNLFLMEAMWTRYFPLAKKFQEIIASGRIGTPRRVFSDLSFDIKLDTIDPASRMVDPLLAGGAILDVGPYALNWPTLAFFPYPTKPKMPVSLVATADLTSTGIDASSTAIATFVDEKSGKKQIAVISTSIGIQPAKEKVVRVEGEKGEIWLEGLTYRPSAFVVRDYETDKTEKFEFELTEPPANGMFWEADEVARCIKDGLKQSPRMTWDDSIYVMSMFDAIREQTGQVYPESIERV